MVLAIHSEKGHTQKADIDNHKPLTSSLDKFCHLIVPVPSFSSTVEANHNFVFWDI